MVVYFKALISWRPGVEDYVSREALRGYGRPNAASWAGSPWGSWEAARCGGGGAGSSSASVAASEEGRSGSPEEAGDPGGQGAPSVADCFYLDIVKKMNKDAQMRAAINQKLIETGERERLKELLRAKLIECGWKDQLKAHCKDVIKEKGLEHVTVDDLVAEITPKGRALVPDSVKKELLQRIRTFLAQHASL